MPTPDHTRTASLRVDSAAADVWCLLQHLKDPEIPVLGIIDLGIVRSVQTLASGEIEIRITPTYSGCPATHVIKQEIRSLLDHAGFREARIIEVIDPPWSSDWITEKGREALRAYGIAPPDAVNAALPICPRCGSSNTKSVSEFGSTPCKSLHQCASCLEPFDRFKCI